MRALYDLLENGLQYPPHQLILIAAQPQSLKQSSHKLRPARLAVRR